MTHYHLSNKLQATMLLQQMRKNQVSFTHITTAVKELIDF